MLPLVAVLPFMYYPKVLEGDTQPWVLIAGLIALFVFRVRSFFRTADWPLFALSALCVLIYALRSHSAYDTLRATFIQVQFVILWMIGQREHGEMFRKAVKLTIVIWLAFGLLQYASIVLGLPIPVVGRFVEGRSGVPSLTAEASYYGSLSVLQMLYLMADKDHGNRPYILAAGFSVLLSGSLLAILLLVFPLMKLSLRTRIYVLVAVVSAVSALTVVKGFGGASARLGEVLARDSWQGMLFDASLNLRIGHIYFTLFRNLIPSLLYLSPVGFMNQYNSFANLSGIFVETGSNFILPALGELIYGAGLAGALLFFLFLRGAVRRSSTRSAKIEKVVVILASMLNPITLANPFLVIYALKQS